MSSVVRELIRQLESDPLREKTSFTGDLETATSSLFKGTTHADRAKTLSGWLAQYQPCLFGKIAARLGGLSFCFLSDADLAGSDEEIRTKIQADRRRWRARAFNGNASGFVI